MSQTKEAILQLIEDISGCMSDSHVISANIARGTGGREVSLAITKLQEAQHWLTQAIQELDAKE